MENDKTEILGADKTEFIGGDKTEFIGGEKTEFIGSDKTELIGADKTEFIGGAKPVIMPVVSPEVDEKTEENPPTLAQPTEVLPKEAIKNPNSQAKTVELKYREHFLDANKAVYTQYGKAKSGIGGGNIFLIALIIIVLIGGALGGYYIMNRSIEKLEAPVIGTVEKFDM